MSPSQRDRELAPEATGTPVEAPTEDAPRVERIDRRRILALAGLAGGAGAVGIALRGEDPRSATPTGDRPPRRDRTRVWARPAADLSPEQAAARFLTQATFGASYELVQEVASAGPEAWLEEQLALPASLLTPIFDDFAEQAEISQEPIFFSLAWWQRVMDGPDLVRHRIALALSEIFVISLIPDELADSPRGAATYYDLLVEHALGNYRDLLYDVTLHPCMGFFLSHARNLKGDPDENRFPDENYAREIMQLFTIGLYELNPDGTRKLDGEGRPIPTYTNADISELARVFTGLTYAGGEDDEPGPLPVESLQDFLDREYPFDLPMVPYQPAHDRRSKTLLGGLQVPGGQTVLRDVRTAIDHLFNHPNVGPFVARRLIQRLVTSNPSPAYVGRVAAAFADDGQGVRGDMKAVVRAILLDPEARDPSRTDEATHGMLREPFVRYVQLCRTFKARSASGYYFNHHFEIGELIKQAPLYAPSVFNFFLPDHQPLGPIAEAGLVAPEFQITNAHSVIAMINFLDMVVLEGETMLGIDQEWAEELGLPYGEEELWVELDLSAEIDMAEDLDALLDRLDLLLTHGLLSSESRAVIRTMLAELEYDPEERVRFGIYLIALSAEAAILR